MRKIASIVMIRARGEMVEAAKEVEQHKKKAETLAKKMEEFLVSINDLQELSEQRRVALVAAEGRFSDAEQELSTARAELSTKTVAYDEKYHKSDQYARDLATANIEITKMKDELDSLYFKISVAKFEAVEEFLASETYKDLLDEEYIAAEQDYRDNIVGAGLDLAALDAYILSKENALQEAIIEQPKGEEADKPREGDQAIGVQATDLEEAQPDQPIQIDENLATNK